VKKREYQNTSSQEKRNILIIIFTVIYSFALHYHNVMFDYVRSFFFRVKKLSVQ